MNETKYTENLHINNRKMSGHILLHENIYLKTGEIRRKKKGMYFSFVTVSSLKFQIKEKSLLTIGKSKCSTVQFLKITILIHDLSVRKLNLQENFGVLIVWT